MSRSVSVSGRRTLADLEREREAHVTAQFLSDGWSPDGHAPLERSGNGNQLFYMFPIGNQTDR
jgi:hypothetical protein